MPEGGRHLVHGVLQHGGKGPVMAGPLHRQHIVGGVVVGPPGGWVASSSHFSVGPNGLWDIVYLKGTKYEPATPKQCRCG
ncbi:hypothetical protein [Pontibacter pamirensis]|uniref:hypothetical protein n=1 Tax=Pontibacter pamirensis TaxID=2562824 RepID=UPI001F3AC37A|nr:hypothetical protein [Pontibacter pamirensis]